jgi:hypothetical protein
MALAHRLPAERLHFVYSGADGALDKQAFMQAHRGVGARRFAFVNSGARREVLSLYTTRTRAGTVQRGVEVGFVSSDGKCAMSTPARFAARVQSRLAGQGQGAGECREQLQAGAADPERMAAAA